jgi:hypothetical protein
VASASSLVDSAADGEGLQHWLEGTVRSTRHQNQAIEGEFSRLNREVKGRESNARIEGRHTSWANVQGRLRGELGPLKSVARSTSKITGQTERSNTQKYLDERPKREGFFHAAPDWRSSVAQARTAAPDSSAVYTERAATVSRAETAKRSTKGRGKKRKKHTEESLTAEALAMTVAKPKPAKKKKSKKKGPAKKATAKKVQKQRMSMVAADEEDTDEEAEADEEMKQQEKAEDKELEDTEEEEEWGEQEEKEEEEDDEPDSKRRRRQGPQHEQARRQQRQDPQRVPDPTPEQGKGKHRYSSRAPVPKRWDSGMYKW